jgi:hypothetical protein
MTCSGIWIPSPVSLTQYLFVFTFERQKNDCLSAINCLLASSSSRPFRSILYIFQVKRIIPLICWKERKKMVSLYLTSQCDRWPMLHVVTLLLTALEDSYLLVERLLWRLAKTKMLSFPSLYRRVRVPSTQTTTEEQEYRINKSPRLLSVECVSLVCDAVKKDEERERVLFVSHVDRVQRLEWASDKKWIEISPNLIRETKSS